MLLIGMMCNMYTLVSILESRPPSGRSCKSTMLPSHHTSPYIPSDHLPMHGGLLRHHATKLASQRWILSPSDHKTSLPFPSPSPPPIIVTHAFLLKHLFGHIPTNLITFPYSLHTKLIYDSHFPTINLPPFPLTQ